MSVIGIEMTKGVQIIRTIGDKSESRIAIF